MEKQEYRILIKHRFLIGKTSEQSLQWLQKCYPTSTPSRTTVYRWFSEFKMGRTGTGGACKGKDGEGGGNDGTDMGDREKEIW
ncbi:hypothetical protein ALC57_14711 [Trachymyrmex cornetzi]|uniref:Mos1 transposase HTH domain-containing protein n=1 Tax=Trachymyrmex cornetzi TaxID=471704 RepID=A0A151IY52_9HYME|nr:hypothetical protein ALC57_14711 [Trachymyrmex cornetzi]